MPRRYDAPWVVLGMPDKNKMLVSYLTEMLEIWDELDDKEDTAMAERVVNRFMIIKGLKAYLSGDYDNADNPYWDAENETFNGGQLAIDAIQMLETDYKLINETMNLLEKATGVEIGGKSAVDA